MTNRIDDYNHYLVQAVSDVLEDRDGSNKRRQEDENSQQDTNEYRKAKQKAAILVALKELRDCMESPSFNADEKLKIREAYELLKTKESTMAQGILQEKESEKKTS